MWQLDPDWGYPRGPHAKTRLVSNASRRAAQNRIALSEEDALEMNLHLCSFAPAVAHTVCAATFADLWQRHSYGWTNPSSGTVVQVLDRRHLSAVDAARIDGACGSIAGEAVGLPAGAGAGRAPDDPLVVLPRTGGVRGELAVAGVAALIGGVVAMRRGGNRAPESRTGNEPEGATDG